MGTRSCVREVYLPFLGAIITIFFYTSHVNTQLKLPLFYVGDYYQETNHRYPRYLFNEEEEVLQYTTMLLVVLIYMHKIMLIVLCVTVDVGLECIPLTYTVIITCNIHEFIKVVGLFAITQNRYVCPISLCIV